MPYLNQAQLTLAGVRCRMRRSDVKFRATRNLTGVVLLTRPRLGRRRPCKLRLPRTIASEAHVVNRVRTRRDCMHYIKDILVHISTGSYLHLVPSLPLTPNHIMHHKRTTAKVIKR